MDKRLQKTSDELEGHGSIIMTYTTVINKCMITIEVSPSKYWLRVYRNGELYRQKNYKRFKDAVNSFYRYIKKLDFKYNYCNGGSKHYEHK